MTRINCGWRSVWLAVAGGGALMALAGAAWAAGPFDGTYTGEAALVRGNNGSICRTFHASITVTDGHLTYVHGGGYAVIKTDVAADGSFTGTGAIAAARATGAPAVETLQGKIAGAAIDADASGPACAFHLTLRKAG